ncbi:anti-sigma factor domain-containing protein [Aquirhabdus sp.]|uniref:anti-sigma factor n=1 Tax=Aquirhabdus sp. TaxID=2824160 RepID=UPI00396CCC92
MDREESPLNLIAAQYVLGTLSASARLRFQARLQQEPALRRLTYAWERRLNPLTHLLVPRHVPPEVWQKIEARLDAIVPLSSDPAQPVVVKAANDGYWKPWAWASSAIAAGLALFILVRPEGITLQPPVTAQVQLVSHDVAVLSTDKNAPAWVVRQQGQTLVLSALNTEAVPSGRDLELWSIQGNTVPRSLGVLHIKNGQATISGVAADLVVKDSTLAISLEPKNGSPTGQPTGAVLYTGKIIRG